MLEWLEAHMLPCSFKSILGVDCPGCGFQRSLILLLKGRLGESIALYPALLPFLFTVVYTVAHLRFDFKNGARNIVWAFVLTTALVVGNFLFKFV